METLQRKDKHDNLFWVLGATVILYLFVCEIISEILFSGALLGRFWDSGVSDGMKFVLSMYLTTIVSFVFIYIYCARSARNRFVLETIKPGYRNNNISSLLKGLLVGFIMNFACIAAALLNGDIKLTLSFAVSQIPFFIFALVCVFIQSSSEELWCRGFTYERLNVRYPLWVAVVVNGVFFGALHLFNPGVSALPIIDIMICGISFSLAKWYTKSIFFPFGIHTMWNFTQNFLFGLPNSGLVSQQAVFTLDAASARDSLVYNASFGVEGAWPAVLADLALGLVCLALAKKNGRLGELMMTRDELDLLEAEGPKKSFDDIYREVYGKEPEEAAPVTVQGKDDTEEE